METVSSEVYRGSPYVRAQFALGVSLFRCFLRSRYRSLGIALIDSLDEYVRANIMTDTLARAVLAEFDRAIAAAIASKVQARATVKAHLKTYRLCEEVWYFSLRNATFKMDGRQTVSTPKINVIAIRNQDVVESEVPTPQTSPMKRY
ncbi:hypothetical protein FB451DRAFT_1413123 [Mycena latifolia]|nr:hypothetical protein FB451DRAFT_1413123 [Mycena latifolia]